MKSENLTGSGERDILMYTPIAATSIIALTIIETILVIKEVERTDSAAFKAVSASPPNSAIK